MTLRITLGKASPANRQVEPSACRSAPATRARTVGDENRKLQRKMREHVAHHARQAPPFGALQARRRAQRVALVEIMRPFAARHFRHRGEQAFVRALAQQHAAVGAQRDEGRAAPQFAFALGRLAREGLLVAARVGRADVVPRTQRASRPLGRAQRRAEIHQRLREIAGALRRQQRSRQLLDVAAWPPATPPRPQTAAPPRARHCRPPAPRRASKAIAATAAAV